MHSRGNAGGPDQQEITNHHASKFQVHTTPLGASGLPEQLPSTACCRLLLQEERAAAAAAAEELRAEVQREADEAAAAKISEANAKYQDVLAQLKAERQRIASLQAELQAERNHGVTLEVGSLGGAAGCQPARDEGVSSAGGAWQGTL